MRTNQRRSSQSRFVLPPSNAVGPSMDAFNHDPLSFQGDERLLYDNVPEGERFKPFCPSMDTFSHDPPSFQGDAQY